MQLTTLLVETIKSGKMVVSQDNTEALEITAQEKKIDVNAKDKDFIKEIISSVRQGSTEKGVKESIDRGVGGIKAAREMMPLVKDIVEDLCREGVTVTISYKGDKVVTIGRDADSKLTRLITGTKGIEVNKPLKLIEMGI
mgnify:CR=1 FL=1|jgi:hypothetical protein